MLILGTLISVYLERENYNRAIFKGKTRLRFILTSKRVDRNGFGTVCK